jgi:hypothetical protein
MLPLIPIISGLISVVPSIAGWFGGDKAEDAASKIADIATSLTGIGDTEKAVDAILKDPNLQLKFMTTIDNNRVALDKAFLVDRQDARKSHKLSMFPAILCSALTLGLFAFISGLMFLDIPAANMRLIDTVFGSYLTAWIGSCAYWFGTSRGSAEKNK